MMERERIVLGMEALETGVRERIREPPTLRRSGFAAIERNAPMGRGANAVTLASIPDRTLHIVMRGNVNILKKAENLVGKGSPEKMGGNPLDL